MCAVYRRNFADAAEKALQEGRYKIDTLFAATSTQTIAEGELEAAGFSPKMFSNLNTPQELADATEITTPHWPKPNSSAAKER